jgi:hypothetical protein
MVDEVDVTAAWEGLTSGPRAQLVDVRTRAEWTYVGIPDLAPIGKRAVLVEWQTFPDQAVDARFVERLAGELKALGVSRATTSILFAVREAGAWQPPERWPRLGIRRATTSQAVLKVRSTICGIAASLVDGKRPDSPGCKVSPGSLGARTDMVSASTC